MKFIKLFTLAISLVSLFACGGGGGGGSSTQGVRILHGAIELSQIDAISSLSETGEAFTTANFGDSSSYQAVPFEEQSFRIVTHNNSGDTISSVSGTIENRHTIMLYGTEGTTGNKIAFFNDEPGDFVSGSAKVRLLNGVAAAAALDILIDGSSISSGVSFGSASEYLDVSAGVHTLLVRRSADHATVFSGSLTFEESRAYTMFTGGEAGYFAFGRFLVDQ
ncbi:MAG: DUF4397 domain-containing protein [Bdellovibrionales bacterium]|nr:DUF4397 domain-containing protein [Bdellovibrionales bacterium]